MAQKFGIGAPKFGIGHLIFRNFQYIFANISGNFQLRTVRPSANGSMAVKLRSAYSNTELVEMIGVKVTIILSRRLQMGGVYILLMLLV